MAEQPQPPDAPPAGSGRDRIFVEHESGPRPFMRGILVHSLMARGLSFEDALGAANATRDRLRGRGVVPLALLASTVDAVLAERRFDNIAGPFDREGIWYARVDDYEALRRNPQVVHDGLLREIPVGTGSAVVARHPLRYDGRASASADFAARAGEHTREILAELGFASPAIDELLRCGAAHAPAPNP